MGLGFVAIAALPLLLAWLQLRRRKIHRTIAFFHPYTNDGGGGERVLWCAVRAVQEMLPDVACVVYTGDAATSESLAARAWDRFGVKLHSPPGVVKLRHRKWVEAATYPHFTLVGQCLGSMILGLEALVKLTPILFFDTSGYAFTYPLAWLFGCKVACYTHYPTISSDMISRVAGRLAIYNNSGVIAKSYLLSSGKIVYYKIMALMYGIAGRCSNLTMVNSSWTQSHIENLWGTSTRIVRVYPPCSTESLQELPLERGEKDFYFISVAQFRPEKNHRLQLEAFAMALKHLHSLDAGQIPGKLRFPRLKLVGSCRNEEDSKRFQGLKDTCHELKIEEHVDFCENVTYRVLRELLGGAAAGIHSMVDEHFGISVVEYMAAGAIPIAHNSAGPKQDIVLDEDGEPTGFLASTVVEFADAMLSVFSMTREERIRIAKAARKRASRFSEDHFDESFKAAMKHLVKDLALGTN